MWRWGLLWTAGCALRDGDFDLDGWSGADGDCDDLDAAVNPDAADAVGDGIDQDCDGADALMAVSGKQHRCVLLDDGGVWCDGDNEHHQLDVPEGHAAFVEIAAGDYHTCGLDALGYVECWGDDSFGQSSPPADAGFVGIDAGGNWSLGARGDGPADCWGQCRVRPTPRLP